MMRFFHLTVIFIGFTLPLIAQQNDPNDPGLPPGTLLLPESALPKYESEIDHKGVLET